MCTYKLTFAYELTKNTIQRVKTLWAHDKFHWKWLNNNNDNNNNDKQQQQQERQQRKYRHSFILLFTLLALILKPATTTKIPTTIIPEPSHNHKYTNNNEAHENVYEQSVHTQTGSRCDTWPAICVQLHIFRVVIPFSISFVFISLFTITTDSVANGNVILNVLVSIWNVSQEWKWQTK